MCLYILCLKKKKKQDVRRKSKFFDENENLNYDIMSSV